MFNGYLTIDGTEVMNAARTAEYIRIFLPKLDVKCDDGARLRAALGHQSYVSPAQDNAPWYHASRPETGRFYGLFPSTVEGADDSTRTVDVTELTGDGAVHSMPRHGSLEVRVKALAVAADEEAMAAGMAWLRDVLDATGCDDGELDCRGSDITMLAALPAAGGSGAHLMRTFYESEVIEGPLVTKEFPTRSAVAKMIEFTFNAGVPWAFTPLETVGLLDMDSGIIFSDPAGEDCSVQNTAYDDYINDPYYTAIEQPPRPPVIKPPNLLPIDTWERRTIDIPAATIQRWGRTVPVVSVMAGSTAMKQLRLRFYEDTAGVSGCDYSGEFLVSYLPAGATLHLDGIHRDASVTLANGKNVPGGHLLFGSDGRPFTWPTLGCHSAYTMTADLMPGQTGISVLLETAVRE